MFVDVNSSIASILPRETSEGQDFLQCYKSKFLIQLLTALKYFKYKGFCL